MFWIQSPSFSSNSRIPFFKNTQSKSNQNINRVESKLLIQFESTQLSIFIKITFTLTSYPKGKYRLCKQVDSKFVEVRVSIRFDNWKLGFFESTKTQTKRRTKKEEEDKEDSIIANRLKFPPFSLKPLTSSHANFFSLFKFHFFLTNFPQLWSTMGRGKFKGKPTGRRQFSTPEDMCKFWF